MDYKKLLSNLKGIDAKINQKTTELNELKEKKRKIEGKIVSVLLEQNNMDMGDIIDIVESFNDTKPNTSTTAVTG